VADAIKFDWDDANVKHLARHNVRPEEAEQVILNGPADIGFQIENAEERFAVVGPTNSGRILTLVLTECFGAVRPITAWDSTREEEAQYWNAKGA
jgi:hypothetical protein